MLCFQRIFWIVVGRLSVFVFWALLLLLFFCMRTFSSVLPGMECSTLLLFGIDLLMLLNYRLGFNTFNVLSLDCLLISFSTIIIGISYRLSTILYIWCYIIFHIHDVNCFFLRDIHGTLWSTIAWEYFWCSVTTDFTHIVSGVPCIVEQRSMDVLWGPFCCHRCC